VRELRTSLWIIIIIVVVVSIERKRGRLAQEVRDSTLPNLARAVAQIGRLSAAPPPPELSFFCCWSLLFFETGVDGAREI
jgi:hypothetical protein